MFNPTNQEIVGGFNRRKAWAIKMIYERYRPRVFELSRQLMGNDVEAEDLCSDVFKHLLLTKKRMEKIKDISDSLYLKTKNLAEDKRRRKETRDSNAERFAHLQPVYSEDDYERAETIAVFYEYVIRKVDDLTPRRRMVFRKFYLEGKTLEEIALELNISKQTVSNKKTEAMNQLRIEIKPFGKYFFTITFIL